MIHGLCDNGFLNKTIKDKTAITVLTEVNEHLAEALSHVLWHCQDTGDVVVEEGIFLLHFNEEIRKNGLTRYVFVIVMCIVYI